MALVLKLGGNSKDRELTCKLTANLIRHENNDSLTAGA